MTLRTNLTLLLALAILFPACSGTAPPEIVAISESPEEKAPALETALTHLDASGAAKLLDEDPAVTVLDVRTPAEYVEGHIKDAVNVDFKAPDFKVEAAKLDKTKPYLVHCRSGGRSTASLEILQSLGFEKIYHLDGGLNGWTESGHPVEK